jgi:hypothetical protein
MSGCVRSGGRAFRRQRQGSHCCVPGRRLTCIGRSAPEVSADGHATLSYERARVQSREVVLALPRSPCGYARCRACENPAALARHVGWRSQGIKELGGRLLDGLCPGRSNTRPSIFGGQVAQLVEQRTENPRVGGSIPPLATIQQVPSVTSAGSVARYPFGFHFRFALQCVTAYPRRYHRAQTMMCAWCFNGLSPRSRPTAPPRRAAVRRSRLRGSYHDMKCLNVLTAIQATELQINTLQINNGRSLGTLPVIT